MRNWVWWPCMSRDISLFISCCLVFKRFASSPRVRTLLGVLSSPVPLDMLSLDFVGPCQWGLDVFHYLVSIDHSTRFVMTVTCSSPSTDVVIQFINQQWMPSFGAPTMVLTDRGSVFTSSAFQSFVIDSLCSTLVFTSPLLPLGKCHKWSVSSIARAWFACCFCR